MCACECIILEARSKFNFLNSSIFCFFDSIPDFLSIVGALLVILSVVLVTLNKLIFEKFF